MEMLCPECRGTLITADGRVARCSIHGGEYQILFTRWSPPPPGQPAAPVWPTVRSAETGPPGQALEASSIWPVLPPASLAEAVAVDNTAAPPLVCAQHPTVVAVHSCRQCGIALCATCAFSQEDGTALCPNCYLQPTAQPPSAPDGVCLKIKHTHSAKRAAALPSSVPDGVYCIQHPHLQATQQCKMCGYFICATCDFEIPGGYHLCPACATTPQTKLSHKRKMMLVGSYVLAVWCTVILAALMSGALADTARDQAGATLLGFALIFFLMVPAIAGLTLGWTAMDRRSGSAPVIWVAIVWNGLVAAAFLLMCIIGQFR